MNYQQTLDYLYRQLPMFQRIGAAAFKKDLTNTIQLMKILNHPEKKFPSIHVAGTNGKGSVTHILSAILQTTGLKVGLYTSPHLKDFRERIKINGKMMDKKFVVDFVKHNRKYFRKIKPSFFEITVAMAFDYFAKKKVDIAVVEVGMGGRFDSTNIITPILSVITNISLDHQQFLGNTLSKIAFEKAGIIKKNIPVVIGESHPETENIFIKKAKECSSPIYFADQKIRATHSDFRNQIGFITPKEISFTIHEIRNNKIRYYNLLLDLTGDYQQKNIVTVIQSVDILKTLGYKISKKQIYSAFLKVKKLTKFSGRWEILSKSPLLITDSAHNVAGIEFAMNQLKNISHNNLHIVFGMVNDKDTEKILNLLPQNAIFYFCKPDIPRGLDENILKEAALKNNLKGNSFSSVQKALNAAKKNALKNDLIYAGGSMFVVAEVI